MKLLETINIRGLARYANQELQGHDIGSKETVSAYVPRRKSWTCTYTRPKGQRRPIIKYTIRAHTRWHKAGAVTHEVRKRDFGGRVLLGRHFEKFPTDPNAKQYCRSSVLAIVRIVRELNSRAHQRSCAPRAATALSARHNESRA